MTKFAICVQFQNERFGRIFLESLFELKISRSGRPWTKKFTTGLTVNQVLLQRVRFLERNFGFRSKTLTQVDNMNFSHRFSIISRAVETFNSLIQKIIAIAVRTKIFVLKFKKIGCFFHCAVPLVSQSGPYISFATTKIARKTRSVVTSH